MDQVSDWRDDLLIQSKDMKLEPGETFTYMAGGVPIEFDVLARCAIFTRPGTLQAFESLYVCTQAMQLVPKRAEDERRWALASKIYLGTNDDEELKRWLALVTTARVSGEISEQDHREWFAAAEGPP